MNETKTSRCALCNASHPNLGIRRDETGWATTLVDLVEVHVACADEYRRMREMKSEAYIDGLGCYRWNSNDAIPFTEMLRVWGVDEATIERCSKARRIEDEKATDEYRKARKEALKDPAYRAEFIAELRAAHGTGVTITDVLTGEKFEL